MRSVPESRRCFQGSMAPRHQDHAFQRAKEILDDPRQDPENRDQTEEPPDLPCVAGAGHGPCTLHPGSGRFLGRRHQEAHEVTGQASSRWRTEIGQHCRLIRFAMPLSEFNESDATCNQVHEDRPSAHACSNDQMNRSLNLK